MGFFFIGLLIVLIGGGWLLGIIGFFQANAALAEIAALRRSIAIVTPPRPAESSEETVQDAAATIPPDPEPSIPEPSIPEPSIPEPLAPEPFPPELPAPAARPSLETLVATRWGTWLGALAILLSGVFLVRYAAEQGIVGPAVRCALAALLGMAMIGASRFLRGRSLPFAATVSLPDYTPSALGAGGVALLFAAAYGAGPLYALVPPSIAFVLLAGVAFLGMALSILEGQLVAAIGIVGAFATPALVQTDTPDLVTLFIYLLVVMAAALSVVRYSGWVWLGWATTIAAAGWVLVAGTVVNAANVWAPALFVPAAAALNLGLLPPAALETAIGRRLAWVPYAILGILGVLLAGDWDEPIARTGVMLLAPIAILAGIRKPALDRLPWLAVLLQLALLWAWPLPGTRGAAAFLTDAALIAAFLAGSGLWRERATGRRMVWAALPAAAPVLLLAMADFRVQDFQPAITWALAGLALAGGLVATTALAIQEGDRRRAGVHAAGAVAAIALACAMILTDQWLTLAVALLLPPLAWIEAATDVSALRQVTTIVAGVALVRLLLNWYVLDYALGGLPIMNGLITAYGLPAAAFAFAAREFRRGGDDLTVAILRTGAAALATVFVALEIHHWATGGSLRAGSASFLEEALHVDALAILSLATLAINRTTGATVLRWAWQIQATLACIGAGLLLLANPAFTGQSVGRWPVLDALLAAYLVPALVAAGSRFLPECRGRSIKRFLEIFPVVAGFAWLSLEVRHVFNPRDMTIGRDPSDAELWTYSGVWLAYGLALMATGFTIGARIPRLAGLAIVGLVTLKVFLIDMAGLAGLFRVLSFLGLGLALIGLGSAYRRFAAE